MSRMIFVVAVASIGICTVWGAASEIKVSPVQQCSGQNHENLSERVNLSNCHKSRCKFRKGTSTTVTIHFTPTTKIKDLITEVSAEVQGVSLPFIGVTGTSACDHIVKADSGEAASCPLEANVEYKYTNTFPVETFYPSIAHLQVHWALKTGNTDLICFEVPAAIAEGKNGKNKA